MNLAVLGTRIRQQREKCHLTQAQVANSLMISPQAVSKWERGDNAPDIACLASLARVLGVTTDWILSGEESPRETFDATVFCTSLRTFACRSAQMAPRDVALWINGIFHVLTESVLTQQGVPVKYVGDGFLAYFAGIEHPGRALSAAKDAINALGNPNLLITLHGGPVYLGTIGHHEYARPDIMGDTVNTTFLINQWASGECAAQLLLTEAIAQNCHPESFGAVAVDRPGLPAKIYEPKGGIDYEKNNNSGIPADRSKPGT